MPVDGLWMPANDWSSSKGDAHSRPPSPFWCGEGDIELLKQEEPYVHDTPTSTPLLVHLRQPPGVQLSTYKYGST